MLFEREKETIIHIRKVIGKEIPYQKPYKKYFIGLHVIGGNVYNKLIAPNGLRSIVNTRDKILGIVLV